MRRAVHRLLFLYLLAWSPVFAGVDGSLRTDDGAAAEGASVELVCKGDVRAARTLDASGTFAFEEPSDGCSLSATMSGYDPVVEQVARMPLDPRIAGIVLRRKAKWQGQTITSTVLAASPKALRLVDEAKQASDADRAAELLIAATEADPKFAEAWYQLGRLRLALSDSEGARRALARSIEADPWFVSPYQSLALLSMAAGDWSAVARLSERLTHINPHAAEGRYYGALASMELGDLGAAKRALAELPSGPQADDLRARIEARR